MSSSTLERQRLVEHVVLQHFGPSAAEIVHILLARGQLTFGQLAKLSSLPPSDIHACLLSLSVHCLLYHFETEVGNRLVEMYEVNERNVLRRVRGALFAKLAKDHDDQFPGLDTVVELIWTGGMTTKEMMVNRVAQQLKARAEKQDDDDDEIETKSTASHKSKSSKGKGKAKAQDTNYYAQANEMLRRAWNEGYIVAVTPGSQMSPVSLRLKWEEDLKSKHTGLLSAKELNEIHANVAEKEIEFQNDEFKLAHGRARDKPKINAKLAKAIESDDSDSSSDSDSDDGQGGSSKLPALRDNDFFMLNADRFHIDWRREIVVEYARALFNDTVAEVVDVVLEIADDSIVEMSDERSKTISRNEILSAWNARPSPRPSLQDVFCTMTDVTPPSFNPSKLKDLSAIVEVCHLLSGVGGGGVTSSMSFLREVGEGAGAKWVVHYKALMARVKRVTIEATIKAQLGQEAVRAWRILDVKGKLDEKQLARIAFLTPKDTRETLAKLSSSLMIECQEVPRTADHAPSRTWYLWFVNPRNCADALLGHMYKAMGNLYVQKALQRRLYSAVVDKLERTDVKADPTLLNLRDRENAQEMNEKLEALAVAEMRIDKQAFVLAEF